MKRCVTCLLLLAWAALPARAHFIWIVPDGTDGTKAKVIFSDSLEPDEGVPVEKIAASGIQTIWSTSDTHWPRKSCPRIVNEADTMMVTIMKGRKNRAKAPRTMNMWVRYTS